MPFNPFEEDDDGLGVTILKNMAKKLDCRLEGGRNTIDIKRRGCIRGSPSVFAAVGTKRVVPIVPRSFRV